MSVLNKSQDECIIDIRINWAGYFETMSVPLPVQTLSPGQQKVLSYHKPCRSICPKMLPLLLLPLSLQSRGICIFCLPAGGWTQPCLWRAALATFTPLRRILGWKSVFPFSSPGSWCNQFNTALIQFHRVCLSSLLFPAPVLCWLSTTCALPQGNYPERIAVKPRQALSVTRRRSSWKESVCRNVRGLSFRGKTEKLGSKPGAHPLRKQPSHPFPV